MKLLLINRGGSKSEFDVTCEQLGEATLLLFRGRYYTFQYKVHGEDTFLYLEQNALNIHLMMGEVQ